MANLGDEDGEAPVFMLIAGDPGTAKTGALVALIEAGFKLRILDYDGNLDPLRPFVKNKAMLRNVDAMYFEDKMRVGNGFMQAEGIPTAFKGALDALDEWKYTTKKGVAVSLGKSRDWGSDTIVVLDSLTQMGDAAFSRSQKFLNRTPANTTQQVWQLAMSEQLKFIKRLTNRDEVRHHVIVLAHLKIISPKDTQKDDSDLTKQLKERIAEIVPTKLHPRALGYELPQVIAGEFPNFIKTESVVKFRDVKRIIRTQPDGLLDLKVAAPGVPAELPIDDGLLTIFKALAPQAVETVQRGVSK